MTKAMLMAAAAAAAITSASAATARPPADRNELDYFLPRTRVAASVRQQIERCPTIENPVPIIVTAIEIRDRLGADPAAFVRVNARSGILSGRTTRLELRQNGTLSAFNATTQGEGGPVLSAVIGAAATLAAWSVGVPVPPGAIIMSEEAPRALRCNAVTLELVQRLAQVETQIAMLQTQVAEGTEGPAAGLTLTNLRTELDALKVRLTIAFPDTVMFDVSPADVAGGAPVRQFIRPVTYESWFEGSAANLAGKVVGAMGFRATLTPNRALLALLGTGDGSALPATGAATPYLFYRRPVPAVVDVAPCDGAWNATTNDCTLDKTPLGEAAVKQQSVLLPQLSGLFHIPIGNGNIFGTRRAVAAFDEQGAPTALEYGSTTGGADVAGVINAGMSGLTTYRNAETSETVRRTAHLKAIEELDAALARAEAQ